MSIGRCTIRVLLLLFIVLFLLSPSHAGGKGRFFNSNLLQGKPEQIELASHGVPLEEDAGDQARKHGRVLRVAADDYGHYDPSPSMNKPHFKDIPN
ncbi:uncharacterized protein LOC144568356 isoform X1 [Carex rostrata]